MAYLCYEGVLQMPIFHGGTFTMFTLLCGADSPSGAAYCIPESYVTHTDCMAKVRNLVNFFEEYLFSVLIEH